MYPATILLDPILPPWALALILGAVGYASWRTYRNCALSPKQRLGLWALRMGSILILSWILCQASRRTVRVEKEQPVLAVALDISASMEDNPSKAKLSRADRARKFLEDGKVKSLMEPYRLVYFTVGAEADEVQDFSPESIRYNAPRSHLGSGLNRIADRLRADNLAGIVLLSDGLDQSGELLTPKTTTIPLFIPELEEPFEEVSQEEEDWFIADISHPRMMVVNWKANVEVLIRRRGTRAAQFPVHFKQGGKLLRTTMLSFAENEPFQQVTFSIEPSEVGQLVYGVEIAPTDDSEPANNKRDFLIEVSDPKNRVLYLEGMPRWEFKFLKRALLSEKNYQLSAFVRGGDGSFINFDEMSGQAGGEVPTFNAKNLAEYRVVILGDMKAEALKDEDCKHLRDFVDKGGGLLFCGAKNAYGPQGFAEQKILREMLPAVSEAGAIMKEGRFTVDLTPTGRTHPALGELGLETQIPPVLSFWSPVKSSNLGSKLIVTADGSPILVVRRYGQGRVAMILSDSLWRWKNGDTDDANGKTLYSRFVTQLVHWLAPSEKDVEESTMLQALVGKSQVELREKVTIGAVYDPGDEKAATVSCQILPPDGKPFNIPMTAATLGNEVGLLNKTVEGFKCFFVPQLAGRYEVTLKTGDGTQESRLQMLVEKPENERTGAPLGRSYLRKLAEDTDGNFLNWKNRKKLLKDLPFKPREVTLTREYPIWNKWFWLTVLLTLFCLEWWWRRRADLV